jgi:hypothetical protein
MRSAGGTERGAHLAALDAAGQAVRGQEEDRRPVQGEEALRLPSVFIGERYSMTRADDSLQDFQDELANM